jgi:tripartite-type tricarboxylate transporter receptor subunit TctC
VASPIGEDTDICLLSVQSGLDLRTWKSAATPPRVGMTAYGSPTQFRAVLLSSALRLPIKPVVGYQGTSQIRMAMESGEVDGACLSAAAYILNPLPADRFRMVLRAGATDLPQLADVPAADAQELTPEGREELALLTALRSVARFFIVRPGTPADRVTVLRTAFEQTLQDPVFLAAATVARVTMRPRSPAEVETEIRKLLDLPADRREHLKTMLLGPGGR